MPTENEHAGPNHEVTANPAASTAAPTASTVLSRLSLNWLYKLIPTPAPTGEFTSTIATAPPSPVPTDVSRIT